MRSPLDDNKVVQGRCPWMDDSEVVHGRYPWMMVKKPWMIQLSIQYIDECATLRKILHIERLINP